MMPESGGNRTLDLYRAQHFPDRWKLDRTLIADPELADATPFAWPAMVADRGERRGTGSSWDSLSSSAAEARSARGRRPPIARR